VQATRSCRVAQVSPGAPPFGFFEGWDSTVVSRVGFLAASSSTLIKRALQMMPSPTLLRKVREKDGAPGFSYALEIQRNFVDLRNPAFHTKRNVRPSAILIGYDKQIYHLLKGTIKAFPLGWLEQPDRWFRFNPHYIFIDKWANGFS
jgi:hypothetical protein